MVPTPATTPIGHVRRARRLAGGGSRPRGCLVRQRSDSLHARGTSVSVYALSMRSRGWESPPPPQHFISQWHDTYGGAGPGPLNDPGPGGQTSLSSPSTSACGVSTMNCPRCDGLVVQEYLLDSCEGSLSGFQESRCLNCGAIHDDVIRMNQRVPPSLKGFRSPRRRFGPHVPKRGTPDVLATLGWANRSFTYST